MGRCQPPGFTSLISRRLNTKLIFDKIPKEMGIFEVSLVSLPQPFCPPKGINAKNSDKDSCGHADLQAARHQVKVRFEYQSRKERLCGPKSDCHLPLVRTACVKVALTRVREREKSVDFLFRIQRQVLVFHVPRLLTGG